MEDLPEESADKEPGAPVWIISFTDMSLLLLCFMIMLLAASAQSSSTEDEMLEVLASVKVGLGYMPKEGSEDPMDLVVRQIIQQQSPAPARSQIRWPAPAIEGQKWRPKDVQVREKGLIGYPVLFDPGSVQISPKSQTDLDSIAEHVRHHHRKLVIQGHASPEEADNDPNRGHDLAYRRAMAVKRALVDGRGIAESRLHLVSCSFFDAEEERRLQRRVTITLGEYYLPGGEAALRNR